jgi:Aldo/keto reductase family
MLKINQTFQLSASDLVGHLNCRNLTDLDLAVAKGALSKPKVWNPLLEVLRERGLRHEQDYVEHLRSRGLEIETISGVGLDAGAIAAFSLASGFLTGKYRSMVDVGKSSARGPSAAKYLEGKGPKVLAALDKVAGATAATPTQVALAWLMARPSVTAPIASASKPEQLGDLVKAATLKLSPPQIAALNMASGA